MATVGRGILDASVHEFFEGMRTYDPERAVKPLAADAHLQTPWNEGDLVGREAIQSWLQEFLGDAGNRPSFTIRDVAGDGTVTRLTVQVSNRLGRRPRPHRMDVLVLKHVIHQVAISPL